MNFLNSIFKYIYIILNFLNFLFFFEFSEFSEFSAFSEFSEFPDFSEFSGVVLHFLKYLILLAFHFFAEFEFCWSNIFHHKKFEKFEESQEVDSQQIQHYRNQNLHYGQIIFFLTFSCIADISVKKLPLLNFYCKGNITLRTFVSEEVLVTFFLWKNWSFQKVFFGKLLQSRNYTLLKVIFSVKRDSSCPGTIP